MRQSPLSWHQVVSGALALALVVAVAPSVVSAQGPGPGRGRMGHMGRGGPWGGAGFGLGQLDLSDAQRQQVRTIMESRREQFRALAQREREARRALNQAVAADAVNEPLIRELSATLATVQADAAVLRANVRQEVWGVLSAEQQAKAKTLRAERERRMEERRQRREERLKQRQEAQVP